MKACLFLSSTLLFSTVNAAPINLDIYGVDLHTQSKIMTCCKKSISEYIELQQQMNLEQPANSLPSLKKQLTAEKSILNKINALGNFSLTKISTVYYPDDKTTYTTIDIVKKNDSHRLPVLSARSINKHLNKNKELTDLFKLWSQYNQRNLKLIQSSTLDFKSKSCPVVHCTWGFDKNELEHDIPKLKNGASKYKTQLMDIIKHSANNSDREEAIFILAHADNYQEMAHFLIDFTSDQDDTVRNNAMRVLGAILAQHDVPGLNIERITHALNYPYVTDRNKAGYVLLNIVLKNRATHALVAEKSGTTLVNLLRLNQPNNHDFAYRILKVISNKNYSDHDYRSWQNWVDSKKNNVPV